MWTYSETQIDNAAFLRMFIAFLQSCIKQRSNKVCHDSDRPKFVPSAVYLPVQIGSDIPMLSQAVIPPGVHLVTANQWGAISAVGSNDTRIGIKPSECVVLEMCPNPYLEK